MLGNAQAPLHVGTESATETHRQRLWGVAGCPWCGQGWNREV